MYSNQDLLTLSKKTIVFQLQDGVSLICFNLLSIGAPQLNAHRLEIILFESFIADGILNTIVCLSLSRS
jgi:hypothetical protein